MPSNKYAIRWKRRERSYLSERRRSYHEDRRALQGQVVVQWSIERQNGRRMTRAKMKNLFEIRGAGYGNLGN